MKCNKIGTAALGVLFASVLAVTTCVTGRVCALESKGVVYLKNNIHVQEHEKRNECRASYANWTNPGKGHVIIPVNTQVSMGHFRSGFDIIVQSTRKSILFEVNEKNVGMSAEQYWLLITSPEPIKLDHLSEIDRKGIQEGRAYEGMTKEGVRIALGYPARHKTPSLESNTWYFWTNRFKSIAVEFDENGKVKSVGR